MICDEESGVAPYDAASPPTAFISLSEEEEVVVVVVVPLIDAGTG
jgi:hypothetical protein